MDPDTWERVKEICADALAGDAGERETLVAVRCAGDPQVEREVRRLLSAHDRAAPGFLESATGGPVRLVAATPRVGRRIGAWELVGELGAGGMGVVYLAERREADFEQRAALKITRLAADAHLADRLQRERQVLAGLEHPNIAHLLDGGTTEEGLPYFVMEYVEGRPIDRYCDEERLSTDARLALFLQVCSAVGHAHRRLVVHRDLKPSNLLVTADGTPKLLDFGIAKLLADTPADAAVTALPALTPEYASPEQLEGGTITTASDVYSLGVLLYRILTGRLPYSGTGSLPELARERARPPARGLGGDLDSIVAKALRPEPERRYGSVEALAEDLERHRRGFPVAARRGTVPYLLGKFLRRHTMPVAAATLVVGSLVAGIVLASRAAGIAETERARAERISGFLQRMISSPDASWFSAGRSGRDITVVEVLEGAERDLRDEEGLRPAEEAMIRRTLGLTYRGLGLYDEAEALLRASVALDRSASGPGGRELAVGLHELALTLHMKGDYAEAARLYERSIESFDAVADPERIKTVNDHGVLLWQRGDLERAEPLLREVLELTRDASEELRPIHALAGTNLGNIRFARGDLEEAGALYESSIASLRALPETPWEAAAVLKNLAMVEVFRQRFERAEALLGEATALATARLGDDHPHVALVLLADAYVDYRRGALVSAESKARAAIEMQRRFLDEDHLHFARSFTLEGQILTATGRAGEAEPRLRWALDKRRGSLSADDWRMGETAGALGDCLAALGRSDEARALLEESLALLGGALGPEHPLTRDAARSLETLRAPGPDASVQ